MLLLIVCLCSGYDRGDPFFGRSETQDEISAWFQSNVTDAVWNAKQIRILLVWAVFDNPWQKSGPALNSVCGRAAADGAEWIFRIRDDQRFDTPWATNLTAALREMGPPFGVVGPTCGPFAAPTLPLQLVHRTHHDIFPSQYPPSLMRWMDQCTCTAQRLARNSPNHARRLTFSLLSSSFAGVSNVYGQHRTRLLPHVKTTLFQSGHAPRERQYNGGLYLRGELARSRIMIELYLAQTPGMEQQLEAYRADTSKRMVSI